MVSAVGIGCNAFGARIDAEQTTAVVDAAFDAGVTLFDTADVYGGEPGLSETLLGRALGARRDDVVIATKFGMDMRGANGPDWGARGSRRYIRRAVEASLRRLGTDWIDLYQLHTPDPITPIDETLAALHELVTEGKVRYIGSSNFAGWQVVDADWTAHAAGQPAFVSAQNKYSLYDRSADAELIPACEQVGVGPAAVLPAWSTACSRASTGADRPHRRAAGSPSRPRRSASRAPTSTGSRRSTAYADERGISLLDVAIGGLAAQPFVGSVIAGATSADQVKANVDGRPLATRPRTTWTPSTRSPPGTPLGDVELRRRDDPRRPDAPTCPGPHAPLRRADAGHGRRLGGRRPGPGRSAAAGRTHRRARSCSCGCSPDSSGSC